MSQSRAPHWQTNFHFPTFHAIEDVELLIDFIQAQVNYCQMLDQQFFDYIYDDDT